MEKKDKRKQSFFLPSDMIDELEELAEKLDRSMSWVMQRAWVHAREQMRRFPGREALLGDDEESN
jgi:uncharacterized small protein (TIGR04563 family)